MNEIKNLRILSRKSNLAVIQAEQVGSLIQEYFPSIKIDYITKKTSGDLDLKTPLSQMGNAGVFTDDLRNDLLANKCDLAVHSWKDLPLDLGPDSILAGSLKRADQRDILFVKKNLYNKIQKNKKIVILSSSPRRIYNLEDFIKNYLPFNLNIIEFENIRGNIPSRFEKFLKGSADGLIMAKAAVDRILNNPIQEFNYSKEEMKKNIKKCLWTITPLSQNPTSPGQGALGIEVLNNNINLIKIIKKISDQDTIDCVNLERKILKSYGGGCHQKIGVSYFLTNFGLMYSKKGETDNGIKFYDWGRANPIKSNDKKVKLNQIYPKSLENYRLFERENILNSEKKINKISKNCFWISRSSALPLAAKINQTNIVWTSGLNTWKSLVERGIWVNGTSDGMGENFEINISNLTSNPWIKLTHTMAPITKIKNVIHTYFLKELTIEENISDKKFFYWMSSSAFKYVLKKYPEIINGYHACGPGNTYESIKKIIKDPSHLEIVLSYKIWKNNLVKEKL